MSFLRRGRHKSLTPVSLSTRARFDADAELERKAEAARLAMGSAHLLAVPLERKQIAQPLEEWELPIG